MTRGDRIVKFRQYFIVQILYVYQKTNVANVSNIILSARNGLSTRAVILQTVSFLLLHIVGGLAFPVCLCFLLSPLFLD